MQKNFLYIVLILPLSIFGQVSNATDDIDFSNVAYHTDAKTHGKAYKASSLNINAAYLDFNTSIVSEFNSKLRYQQSIGNWKIGFQASYLNLAHFQTNTELGLSLAKDFALNRDWSIRPAIGSSLLNSALANYTGSDIQQNYNLNVGLQLKYKDWQFFGGINSLFSTKDSLLINDSIYMSFQRQAHANIGLKKSFKLDSINALLAGLFYENYQGFNYINASVVYQNRSALYLIGFCTRQFNFGCGLLLPRQQQLMATVNLQQYSLLQKEFRPGFQLNYKWQFAKKPTFRGTITPSF